MNGEVEPIVGNWYRSTERGQTFTVIGVDEDEGIIEIQHVNGEIEEIDTDAWARMDLEPADEPDEWRGILDDVEDDDLDYDDDDDDDWGAGEDDWDYGGGERD